jgi:hypothetical protein
MAFDPVRAGGRAGASVPAPLEVRAAGLRRTLRPGETLVVGRDEASDLQLIGPRVSREHLHRRLHSRHRHPGARRRRVRREHPEAERELIRLSSGGLIVRRVSIFVPGRSRPAG